MRKFGQKQNEQNKDLLMDIARFLKPGKLKFIYAKNILRKIISINKSLITIIYFIVKHHFNSAIYKVALGRKF